MIRIEEMRKDLRDAMGEIAYIEQGIGSGRRGLRAVVSHLNLLHLSTTLQAEQTAESWPAATQPWPRSEFENQCRALQKLASTGGGTTLEIVLTKWLISEINNYIHRMTLIEQTGRLERNQRPAPGTVR